MVAGGPLPGQERAKPGHTGMRLPIIPPWATSRPEDLAGHMREWHGCKWPHDFDLCLSEEAHDNDHTGYDEGPWPGYREHTHP